MSKSEVIFNFIFQSGSLQKDEKQKFVNDMESKLKSYGFTKVSNIFGGDRKYYKAIRFEKLRTDDLGHWIELVFEKYGQRRFYVNFGISKTTRPNQHILVGSLIRKKNQTQYW